MILLNNLHKISEANINVINLHQFALLSCFLQCLIYSQRGFELSSKEVSFYRSFVNTCQQQKKTLAIISMIKLLLTMTQFSLTNLPKLCRLRKSSKGCSNQVLYFKQFEHKVSNWANRINISFLLHLVNFKIIIILRIHCFIFNNKLAIFTFKSNLAHENAFNIFKLTGETRNKCALSWRRQAIYDCVKRRYVHILSLSLLS